ncbi:MAG: hypothetical protein L0215_05440 [Gemmataceae bacterium]|nr:hypothetical protein [Gemmataceae bacterium]
MPTNEYTLEFEWTDELADEYARTLVSQASSGVLPRHAHLALANLILAWPQGAGIVTRRFGIWSAALFRRFCFLNRGDSRIQKPQAATSRTHSKKPKRRYSAALQGSKSGDKSPKAGRIVNPFHDKSHAPKTKAAE